MAIASSILGALLTWVSRDWLFSLLISGKPLSARSLITQTGFSFLLFIVFFTVLLFFCRKAVLWLTHNPLFSFTVISLIPLAAYAWMGSFSRYVADDFSSATLTVQKGICGATLDWYLNWSGRYSASFFDSLAGYVGPSAMRWETPLAVILLCVGISLTLSRVWTFPSRFTQAGISIIGSSLILTISFVLAPDLPQALYWGQGMRSLILPLIPASFLAAYFLHRYRSNHKTRTAVPILIAGLVSFFAGGFGETYVAIQITAYLCFVLLIFAFRHDQNKLLPVLITGLVFSLLAMAVIIAAPGNSARQSYFPAPPSLLPLVQITLTSLGTFLGRIAVKSANLISLVLVFGGAILIMWLYAFQRNIEFPPSRYTLRFLPRTRIGLPVITISVGVLLLLASFAPAAYAMSTTPPDRTLYLPSLILVILFFSLGIQTGQTTYSRIRPLLEMSHNRRLLTSWTVFVIYALFTASTTSSILLQRADYQFFAARFDKADRMIREAKQAGESSVQVPEVHNHFGLSDYGAGTTYWLDEAVDSYYGIKVIVNKHLK